MRAAVIRQAALPFVKIIALLMGTAITAALWGCGMKEKREVSEMLSYMEDKYGEEFVYQEPFGGQLGKKRRSIIAVSKQMPERRVFIRADYENGEPEFADNYTACLLKEELEAKIHAPAEQIFGTCRVYYKIPEFAFPAEFDEKTEAEDFLRHPASRPQFYIYVPPRERSRKDREKDLEAFIRLMQEKDYRIRGSVSYAKTKRDYEMITEKNFLSSEYEGYEAEGEMIFSIDGTGRVLYARWLREE